MARHGCIVRHVIHAHGVRKTHYSENNPALSKIQKPDAAVIMATDQLHNLRNPLHPELPAEEDCEDSKMDGGYVRGLCKLVYYLSQERIQTLKSKPNGAKAGTMELETGPEVLNPWAFTQ